MGSGMSQILPGLYVGNLRDAKDAEQLEANKITHILSIHDNAKPLISNMKYLCVAVADHPDQNLSQHFEECIDFIHECRLSGGACLVHCIAGVSRSVTVTVAYMMTITNCSWQECLRAARVAREVANPNFGFQKQLQDYQHSTLASQRQRIGKMFKESPFNDEQTINKLLSKENRKTDKEEEARTYQLPPNAYASK
ncbi:dual specificity protein phosphatase 22-B-like [Anneissia japonica]|uniref:dual specificity protein phosphatase 22-B-like n=1 Tax=Anneissia japonica TaxID=1529436 RepID=UPI00142598FE|nr:dual specificity protein phosphatase 22-B-like [Anneissia japonica]